MNILNNTIIALSSSLIIGSANASLLTFDDIPDNSVQNSYGDMTTYQGFNFSSTLDWVDVTDSSWNYGAYSGQFSLLNNTGSVGIITDENNADFTFDGLWAKKWGTSIDSAGTDSLFGTIAGYNNGILVWEVNTGLNGSYEYYDAQAAAINELHLGLGNYFLVDNLSLNASTFAATVPAALWLFGTGLIGLTGIARRKHPI